MVRGSGPEPAPLMDPSLNQWLLKVQTREKIRNQYNTFPSSREAYDICSCVLYKLLNAYSVPDTVLGREDMAVNKRMAYILREVAYQVLRQMHPVLFTQCLEQSKGGEGGPWQRGGGREISPYSKASYGL